MIKCEYKRATEAKVPNTSMDILYLDGEATSYFITPVDGYQLHAEELDELVIDPELFMATGEVTPGYTTGTKTCPIDYDFEANVRKFYTIPIEEE